MESGDDMIDYRERVCRTPTPGGHTKPKIDFNGEGGAQARN